MVKIFQTNIMMKNGVIRDHQSRLIEEESWDVYIKNLIDGCNWGRKYYEDIIGGLDGTTLSLRHNSLSRGESHNDHCSTITIKEGEEVSQYCLSYLVPDKEDSK